MMSEPATTEKSAALAFEPPLSRKADPLKRRRDQADNDGDIVNAVQRMKPTVGLDDAEKPLSEAPHAEIAVPPATRPVCRLNPDIELPMEGEEIPWNANVRMDLPRYIQEQVKEVCHRGRHTMPYLFLKLMAEAKDEKGEPIFFVRDEDLAQKDRRYSKR